MGLSREARAESCWCGVLGDEETPGQGTGSREFWPRGDCMHAGPPLSPEVPSV